MLFPFQALAPASVWYGPVTVTFDLLIAGNPYDPEQNDLRVRFLADKGKPEERLAYVDYDGTIKATLVTDHPGTYRAVLLRNGKELLEQPQEGLVSATERLPKGFVRVDSEAKNRFRWDNGDPYFPIGFNLGWQNGDLISMPEQIAKMGQNGVNWTRIWASSWDSKNPWWPQGDAKAAKDALWPKALNNWAKIVDACDQAQVPFQMVLFNHGSFSSKVNPNWPDHPWNEAKGGFLKDAADFFTDKEAKRRTKMWLRYAVARWAHSPNLMAWELFNEVEWVDARYANRWGDIAAWHQEMADYLRSIDPYHHLITTSSAMDQPDVWKALDYYQPHTYPPSVLMAVAGYSLPADKPLFFGEFGPPALEGEAVKQGVRDGIYGAMLANHAGSAEFWFWDAVEKQNLYPIYKTAALVAQESGISTHPHARVLPVTVTTEGTADLKFAPGNGWAKAGQTSFELPRDVTPTALSKLPAYLQSLSGGNKELFPQPLTFRFTAAKPGVFRLAVDQISKGGAKLTIYVNDKASWTKDYPGGATETNLRETAEVPFGPGANDVRIENTGADWVRMGSFAFTGLSPQATALGLGESDWAMLRLTAVDGLPKPKVGGISLADGDYDLTVYDLVNNAKTSSVVSVKNFEFEGRPMGSADELLVFKRKLN